MSKTIKLILQSEIRVLPIIPKTYSDLLKTCQDLFGITNAAFQYRDSENDTITFSSDTEYQYVLTSFKSIKLFLVPSSSLLKNAGPGLKTGFIFQIDPQEKIQEDLTKIADNPKSPVIEKRQDFPVIQEILRENYPEFEQEKSLNCGHCLKKIKEAAYLCLQCKKKHVFCIDCELKSSEKHEMVKINIEDLIAIVQNAEIEKLPYLIRSESSGKNSKTKEGRLPKNVKISEKDTELVSGEEENEVFINRQGLKSNTSKGRDAFQRTIETNNRPNIQKITKSSSYFPEKKTSFEEITKILAEMGFDPNDKKVLAAMIKGKHDIEAIMNILNEES